MATVLKRESISGDVSYLIRVFAGRDASGKQTTKIMTWKPPAGMRPSAADKQAEKEAVLFEEKVRSGAVTVDGKIKFAEYAAQWMETAELALKTRNQYLYLLERINPAIGHIPLEKIRPEHLQQFYKNLRETSVVKKSFYVAPNFQKQRKKAGLTQRELSQRSGVSIRVIVHADHGDQVLYETAQKLSDALGVKIETLFVERKGTDKLADSTIWHHHKVIKLLLNAAKKARIIPHNVAAEFMDAPKVKRKQAKYLDDDQARAFLGFLCEEPDIRKKTALMLDLFTGARKGELCGLSWPDVDFEKGTVHIRRASQYVSGHGIIEVDTKNTYSVRTLTVPSFVIRLLAEYRRWWLQEQLINGSEWEGEKERLFIQANGKPIAPDTINCWLNSILEKNGLPHITVHSLRHTFATLQLAAGVDIRTLQARTGHANASTLLDIYSHALQSALNTAARFYTMRRSRFTFAAAKFDTPGRLILH